MIFKKVVVIMLVVILSSTAYSKQDKSFEDKLVDLYVQELEELDEEQLELMLRVYSLGGEHGLGYTLVTIAWKESDFGKYNINLSDGKYGSYGVFQIRLDYALKRNNIKTKWKRDRFAEKLLNDLEFSTNEAVKVLNFWINHHKKNTKKGQRLLNVFASYNAGYKHGGKKGAQYGKDSIRRFKAVQKYFKKYAIEKQLKSKMMVASN